MKVLVSGGGIAGLTTAIALQKKGFETEVFEASPEIKPVGAGIVLGANAVKVVRLLGMYTDLVRLGRQMKHGFVLDQKGKLISETGNVLLADGEKPPTFTIHRADLHAMLLQHYTGKVHTGSRGISFTETENKIQLKLENGETIEGDFLVGADGIHSPLRNQVLPASKERYCGLGCWRGVTHAIPEGVNPDEFSETWGIHGRFGIVPIGGNRIYWFATVPAPRNDQRLRGFSLEEIKKHYESYHPNVKRVLEATDASKTIYSDLIDLEPIGGFSFGRMALAGDAAHATTPNLGQGACQAMEDALVLSHCLNENPAAEGLRRYSEIRLPRTTKVVNRSWNFGRIAENRSPFWSVVRNAMIRMVPGSASEKQIRFLFDVHFPGWE